MPTGHTDKQTLTPARAEILQRLTGGPAHVSYFNAKERKQLLPMVRFGWVEGAGETHFKITAVGTAELLAFRRAGSPDPDPVHLADRPGNETEYVRELLVAFSKMQPRVRVWRQNVGRFELADPVTGRSTGRFFNAGPEAGAADISGIVVGHGWRLEVEVKMDTDRSPEQVSWAEFIAASGGVYALIRYDSAQPLEANKAAAVEVVRRAITARTARPAPRG